MLLLTAWLWVAGCEGALHVGDTGHDTGPAPCTDEEVPSVLVHVEDPAGEPLVQTEVAYVPTGELWTAPEPCPPWGPDGTFACGWERAGSLDIWIDAPGHAGDFQQVEVKQGECHVLTEEIDVVLPPLR